MANSEPVVIASDQSAVPVSGTVTANLSATDNAVLDDIAADTEAIKTAVETIDNAIAGTEMQVDVVTSALPTGASTAANQATIIGHVDGIEGLLTTIDADTGAIATSTAAIQTAVQIIDNAISGNEMQVDVITMPTVTVTATNLDVQSGGADLATSTQASAIQTAVQLIDDTVFTDDAAFTVGTSKVLGVGFLSDETATDSVNEGDIGAARMTLDRKQIVTLQPHTTGGLTIFRSIDLDETEEEIKATAGNLYGYYFANTASSARYLKFYNATAASVTVGTTTPVITIYLPPTSAGHVSFPVPVGFSTAICAAATTGVADSDTGAPGANEVILNAFYF